MKITEALTNSTLRTELYSIRPEVVHFDGAIEEENANYFRIYPNPRKRNKFFRVRVEDVVGDVHQYSNEQIQNAGVSPRYGFTPYNEVSVFQVPVKHGVKIEFITIHEAEAGVYYPIEAVDDLKQKGCSCSSSGCKCGSIGYNQPVSEQNRRLGLCKFMSPCSSGCCMFKSGRCECSVACNQDCSYP